MQNIPGDYGGFGFGDCDGKKMLLLTDSEARQIRLSNEAELARVKRATLKAQLAAQLFGSVTVGEQRCNVSTEAAKVKAACSESIVETVEVWIAQPTPEQTVCTELLRITHPNGSHCFHCRSWVNGEPVEVKTHGGWPTLEAARNGALNDKLTWRKIAAMSLLSTKEQKA